MTTAIEPKVETLITDSYAIEVDTTGRGAFATVKDEHSPFNGISAFASTPFGAIAILKGKVEAAWRELPA